MKGIAEVWRACGYVRLSREDEDKDRYNSTVGQMDLIRDFLSRHPDIRECAMKVDNGYTGSNFDRPAFQEMMAEVKAGRINCIIVKDLSRFGRDHLGTGEYLERIFPFLGVRFIAINDCYDSLYRNAGIDDFLIPFKNLINEAYCRDISIKIRSTLEVKRRSGDFVGAFAAFGYRKAPGNRHKLVIDDYAANVVQDIFRWKLDGYSAAEISRQLNRRGIPAPMTYKRLQGLSYYTPFHIKDESAWSAGMVLRILKNPVYIGVLEQGRVTTPNHKVKRFVQKPREEWAVVEGCHESIIDRWKFESVQRLLGRDIRASMSGKTVGPLSGLVFCGECGAPMVRKTVPSGTKRYVYYVCSAHKRKKSCSPHELQEGVLEGVVLNSLKRYGWGYIDLPKLLEQIEEQWAQRNGICKIQTLLEKKEWEIGRYQRLVTSLHENLAEGIIDRGEYAELKKIYSGCLTKATKQAEGLREELERAIAHSATRQEWGEQILRQHDMIPLDRTIIVSIIERIMVDKERRIEIVYRR